MQENTLEIRCAIVGKSYPYERLIRKCRGKLYSLPIEAYSRSGEDVYRCGSVEVIRATVLKKVSDIDVSVQILPVIGTVVAPELQPGI